MEFINDGTIKLYEFLATPYGEVCEIGLDFALEAGELYVDHYLPPLGDESMISYYFYHKIIATY